MFRRGAAIAICSALLFALAPAHGAERETPKPAAATDAAMPEAKPAPPLAYITVAGAPGDGEQALTAALGKRLSVSGVKTARPYASIGRSSGPTARPLAACRRRSSCAKAHLTGNGAWPPMPPPARRQPPSPSSSCSPRRPRRRPLKFAGERTHLSAADERSSAIANQLTLARHL